MSKTITLRIWNEDEGKVTKTVEVDNVLNVKFETKHNTGIDFTGDDIEIFIFPKYVNVDFKFVGNRVFITVKDRVEQ